MVQIFKVNVVGCLNSCGDHSICPFIKSGFEEIFFYSPKKIFGNTGTSL